MSYGILPTPGSKLGPCAESCEHRDCAAAPRMAAHVCRECGGIVGYERQFGHDEQDPNPEASVHWLCALDEAGR